MKLELKL